MAVSLSQVSATQLCNEKQAYRQQANEWTCDQRTLLSCACAEKQHSIQTVSQYLHQDITTFSALVVYFDAVQWKEYGSLCRKGT
eukprot:1157867-Pelagomonas_calceolata.AAC.4